MTGKKKLAKKQYIQFSTDVEKTVQKTVPTQSLISFFWKIDFNIFIEGGTKADRETTHT